LPIRLCRIKIGRPCTATNNIANATNNGVKSKRNVTASVTSKSRLIYMATEDFGDQPLFETAPPRSRRDGPIAMDAEFFMLTPVCDATTLCAGAKNNRIQTRCQSRISAHLTQICYIRRGDYLSAAHRKHPSGRLIIYTHNWPNQVSSLALRYESRRAHQPPGIRSPAAPAALGANQQMALSAYRASVLRKIFIHKSLHGLCEAAGPERASMFDDR
jgi:hypothetical protein